MALMNEVNFTVFGGWGCIALHLEFGLKVSGYICDYSHKCTIGILRTSFMRWGKDKQY